MAKVTIDTRKAKAQLDRLSNNIKRAIPKSLNRAGEKTKELIINRTARGEGLNGAFKEFCEFTGQIYEGGTGIDEYA